MSAKTKLSPHQHTGRYLPHHQTSYGGLLFVMLLVGTILFGSTALTLAQDVTVQAAVVGRAPQVAPAITQPVSGQHVSNLPIDIRGTCQAGLLVNVYRNEVLGGAAICDQTGQFVIQGDLFIGQNVLTAQMFNQGNQPSPTSAPITVVYDLASSPVNVVNGSAAGSNGSLVINAQSIYKGTVPGQPLTWPIEIVGGVAPYAVSLDWGDSNTDLLSRPQPAVFNISHTYKKAGGYKGGYVLVIKVVDAEGTSAVLQLVAIVNNEVGTVTGSTIPNSGAPGATNWWQLLIAWPVWGVSFLMITSFWLGDLRGRKLKGPILAPPPSASPPLALGA